MIRFHWGVSLKTSESCKKFSEIYKNISESFSKFSEKLLKSTDVLLDVAKNRLESCQDLSSKYAWFWLVGTILIQASPKKVVAPKPSDFDATKIACARSTRLS